jgi:ribosome-binding protein aMBF1 (putative translation factor)
MNICHLRVIQGGKAKIPAVPQPITPKIVFEQCRTLNLYGKQCYVVLHLDKNNQTIGRNTLLAPLSVKEVYRTACLNDSHAIIVARTSDIRRSDQEDFIHIAPLINWGRALGIPLLDYVVTDCDGFTSFQESFGGFTLNKEPAPIIREASKPTPEQQQRIDIEQHRIDIGKRIRTLRIKAGIFKQKDLAEKTGIRPQYISSFEKGYREPTKDEAEKIAAILGIQPLDLVGSPEATDVTPPKENEVGP